MASSSGGQGTVQRVVDHALGVAKESIKAVTREAIQSTGNFLNSASAQLLQCLPGGSSTLVPGRHVGWDTAAQSRPTFRAPQLPAWMQESASSLNKFLLEAAELIDNDDLASAASDLDDQSVRSSEDYMSATGTEEDEYDNASTTSSPHATDGGGRTSQSNFGRSLDQGSSSGWSRSSTGSWHRSRFRLVRIPLRLLRWLLLLLLWPFILCWRFLKRSRQRSVARPLARQHSGQLSVGSSSSSNIGQGQGSPSRRLPKPSRNGESGPGSPHQAEAMVREGGLRRRDRGLRRLGEGEEGGHRRGTLTRRESGSGSLSPGRRPLSHSSSTGSLTQHFLRSEVARTITGAMDYFQFTQHLSDFQRRGVLEELQVLLELFIERCFEGLRKLLLLVCMPWRLFSRPRPGVPPTLFAGSGPRPTPSPGRAGGLAPGGPSVPAGFGRGAGGSEGMVDARTCEDIVKEAGYPYEQLRVVTEDGYILTLERIPRRDSRKALFLQHGVFDSSLGWVSNGVVGSQAFAAHDQGYDVYLGNMRGYASGGHVNPNIGLQRYWAYSVNELGMFDIRAMIETIVATKRQELSALAAEAEAQERADVVTQTSSAAARHTDPGEAQSGGGGLGRGEDGVGESSGGAGGAGASPEFEIQAMSHSLGGAALMVYVVTQRLQNRPHHLSHIILLSPAGFHEKTPMLFDVCAFLLPVLDWVFPRWLPGFFIPTRGLRLLFNKIAQDFQNLPALGALMQVMMSNLMVGGDPSDWVGALRVPHYTMSDMPGVAYRVMKHLAQMKIRRRFCLYDYGSRRANIIAYGSPDPPDLGAHYGVIDIPVDVVSGRQDRLIPPEMVRRHYEALKAGGCEATLQQFEYAHLDFTLAHKQELLSYVMTRLRVHSHCHRGLRHSKSCPRLHQIGRRGRRSRSGRRRSGVGAVQGREECDVEIEQSSGGALERGGVVMGETEAGCALEEHAGGGRIREGPTSSGLGNDASVPAALRPRRCQTVESDLSSAGSGDGAIEDMQRASGVERPAEAHSVWAVDNLGDASSSSGIHWPTRT